MSKALFFCFLFYSSTGLSMNKLPSAVSTMNADQIVDALVVNNKSMLSSLFDSIDTISITTESDISFVYSDIPDESHNFVLETHFSKETAATRIAQITDYFESKKVPWTWWFGPGDTPDNLETYLADYGFSKTEELAGMYCVLPQKKIEKNLSHVQIRRVNTVEQLRDFYRVQFSQDFETVWRKISPRFFDEDSPLEFYVGYAHEKPVTAGLIALHARVGGIYSLATVKDERRKGYATAMLHFFLKRMEERGYHYATLTAMPEAQSLYKKLGFIECCKLRAWNKHS